MMDRVRSTRVAGALLAGLWLLMAAEAGAATTESLRGMAPQGGVTQASQAPQDSYTTLTLTDFLPKSGKAPEAIPGFFNEVPPHLDAAVRYLAEENYTSATALLNEELKKKPQGNELARIHLWLGLTYGTQAIDYPDYGWVVGTSATEHLKKAFALAPESFEAADAARVMAEMVAHSWAGDDPTAALYHAEQKAEQTRKAIDFYYAGVIARRQSQLAWAYSDTTARDRQVLSLFAKATAREPTRYENWAAYLRSLMPVGLHDLATTESPRMYAYFKPLRAPLLYDPGPAATMLSVGAGFDMFTEQQFLHDLVKERPEDPYPRYQLALTAIETSPQLAIERFESFLSEVEKGTVKFKPREQGLKVSALYKLAFLSLQFKSPGEALETYRKVKAISPTYAEVNNNLAAVLGYVADLTTTSPKKLRLLEEAIGFTKAQDDLNYRGKTDNKTKEIQKRLEESLQQTRAALGITGGDGTTTGTKETTATTAASAIKPSGAGPSMATPNTTGWRPLTGSAPASKPAPSPPTAPKR